MTLDELKVGEKGIIKKVNLTGDTRRRMQDLGIIPHTIVECRLKSSLADSTIFKIRGSSYAFRTEITQQIEIEKYNGD